MYTQFTLQFVTHGYCVLLAMKLAGMNTRRSNPTGFDSNASVEERKEYRRKLAVSVVEHVFPRLSGVETFLKSHNMQSVPLPCCDSEDEGKQHGSNFVTSCPCHCLTLFYILQIYAAKW